MDNTKKIKHTDDPDIMSVTSSTECTGLIPAIPESADELEAYDDIGSFKGEQALSDAGEQKS